MAAAAFIFVPGAPSRLRLRTPRDLLPLPCPQHRFPVEGATRCERFRVGKEECGLIDAGEAKGKRLADSGTTLSARVWRTEGCRSLLWEGVMGGRMPETFYVCVQWCFFFFRRGPGFGKRDRGLAGSHVERWPIRDFKGRSSGVIVPLPLVIGAQCNG